MAKKKAKKKAAKKVVEEVLVDGPADEEQEPAAPAAIADEPTCYARSSVPRRGQGTGQSQHMTLAEHQEKFGDSEA